MTMAGRSASQAHILALPNLLTFGRIAAIPAVVACMFWSQIFQGGLWLRWVALFIFITAGFPAVGAAVFGMRGHGEHLLAASRSAKTAQALELNAARLKRVTRQDLLAAELETTAAIMLADLNEWTMAYSERALEIPA